MVTFKWGNVYVEDTALNLPIREAMLHNGIPDSSGFASTGAMRDSIFCTEWFNWPISAEIHYDRMLFIPPAGTQNYVIDTLEDSGLVYDSLSYDSTVTYDTVASDSVMTYYNVISDTIPIVDTFYDTITSAYLYDTVALYYTTVLDSGMAYDTGYIDTETVYDTTMVGAVEVYDTAYDTLRSTFTVDTSRRTDSAFFAPGTLMQYTVQLIHQSGHIDTVETAIYNPSANLWITPMSIDIVNAGIDNDTVMLRVIGSFANVPDEDSLLEYSRETMMEPYPTFSDSTIAIGTGGGVVPPPDTCFYTMGPYSNPSEPLSDDVSILVHYCGISSTITAQVYNMMGVPIGLPSTYTSDEQTWDRLPINAPPLSGTYYITVTVGIYSTTLGYIVF